MQTTIPCPCCRHRLTLVTGPATSACPFCQAPVHSPASIPVGTSVACGKCHGIFIAQAPPALRVFASAQQSCPFCDAALSVRTDLPPGMLVRCSKCAGKFRLGEQKLASPERGQTRLRGLSPHQEPVQPTPHATPPVERQVPPNGEAYQRDRSALPAVVADEVEEAPQRAPQQRRSPAEPIRRTKVDGEAPGPEQKRRSEAAAPAPAAGLRLPVAPVKRSSDAATQPIAAKLDAVTDFAPALAREQPAKQQPAKQQPGKQQPAKQQPGKQQRAKQQPAHAQFLAPAKTKKLPRPGSQEPVQRTPASAGPAPQAPPPMPGSSARAQPAAAYALLPPGKSVPTPKRAVSANKIEAAAAEVDWVPVPAAEETAAAELLGELDAEAGRHEVHERTAPVAFESAASTVSTPPAGRVAVPRQRVKDDDDDDESSTARPRKLLAALAGLALLALGYYFFFVLEPSGPRVYPTEGVVLLDGKPAVGAQVMLTPESPGAGRFLPTGLVGEDGTFKLSTFAPDDGAPAGKYHVSIVRGRLSGDELTQLKQSRTPRQVSDLLAERAKDPLYSKYAGGVLSAEIPTAAGNPLRFELKSK